MKPLSLTLLCAILLPRLLFANPVDLVIYGGTPAGLSAAIVSAREGLSVVVIEPTAWIGGMVTGGLSKTDVGREDTVGGFAREFFTAASESVPGTPVWYAEPHVNMETFTKMLESAGVKVITNQSIQFATKEGPRIAAITTSDGTNHEARVFIDATYEGDLMAEAGVGYIAGRESREQYDEALAGYQPMPVRPRSVEVMSSKTPSLGGSGPSYIHGTPAEIYGLDEKGEPIFGVFRDPGLEPGSADHRTQAYNFRLCVTQRPEIFVPFPKPETYDPARYELLLRLIQAFPEIPFARLFHLGDIANGKYDLNAQGLFSTDYPGANFDYPDGDAATRARIWQEHTGFIQGIFWFLGHDERIPARLREETLAWGLCQDEFADNGHWPYALYVREGRRMIGEYVMTQKDLQSDIFKDDGVAMGSFVIDCHIVQRILAEDGTVRDEGSFQDAPAMPYQIPYRSLTPKAEECDNLLVPVCLSASHIAYCSLRMEPVYMNLGHASGLAAAQVVRKNTPVQSVDVAELRAKLTEQKAVLELASLANLVRSAVLPGLVMDDEDAEKVGHWTGSSYGAPVDGFSSHDGNIDKGGLSITYAIPVPQDGLYELRISYASAPNRASNIPVSISHANGTATILVNQRKVPPIDALFLSLGIYRFAANQPATITIRNNATDGIVGADAVQLLKVAP